jgi:hypothetical protein
LDHRKSLALCEVVSGCASQQHGLATIEHGTRGEHGIAYSPHGADGTGRQRCAIHDRRIQLMLGRLVQRGPMSGVEVRAVFQRDDGRLDRIERGSVRAEHAPAGAQGVSQMHPALAPIRFAQEAAGECSAAPMQADCDIGQRVTSQA